MEVLPGVGLTYFAFFSCVTVLTIMTHHIASNPDVFEAFDAFLSCKLSLTVSYAAALSAGLVLGRTVLYRSLGPLRLLESEQIIEAVRGFLFDTVLFLFLSSPTLDGSEAPMHALAQAVAFVAAVRLASLIVTLKISAINDHGKSASVLERLATFVVALTLLCGFSLWILVPLVSWKSSLMLWTVFEILNVIIENVANLLRIAVHAIELVIMKDEGVEWPERSSKMLVVELTQKIVSSLLTFLFFTMTLVVISTSSSSFASLPIYLIGDVVQSLHSLLNRFLTFKKYQALKKKLHTFPEASLEKLEESDKCIICRDDLSIGSRCLPCNHIFHVDCLRSWFAQQSSCPICRTEVNLDPEEELDQHSGTGASGSPIQRISAEDSRTRRVAAENVMTSSPTLHELQERMREVVSKIKDENEMSLLDKNLEPPQATSENSALPTVATEPQSQVEVAVSQEEHIAENAREKANLAKVERARQSLVSPKEDDLLLNSLLSLETLIGRQKRIAEDMAKLYASIAQKLADEST